MRHHRLSRAALFTLRNLLCGALIGMGAILPGVSGGALAVVFGIYRPFMEILTRPRTALPKYWRMFPPLAAGAAAGFFLLARGITAALHLSDAGTVWLFIGLIFGTLPALFREAGKEGRSKGAWVSCIVCALAVFAGLFYLRHIVRVAVIPNLWWYNFCGILWGLGVVIPGMTASSVMMAMGLYEPMMAGLASLDLAVILGSLPGMVLTILLLARFVTWLFRRYYAAAFHGILGIVTASTLTILPTSYAAWWEIAVSAAAAVLGFLLAFYLERLGRRTQA